MMLALCFALLVLPSVPISLAADQASVGERITAGVKAIPLIDTHEHLPPEAARLKQEQSLFTLLHYVVSDMWADGMDRSAAARILEDASVPLDQKWRTIAPYWANVRTTAYGRNLLRAVRDLYGVDDISESTYLDLSRKIKEANRPGWYETVLRKKANIGLSICDIGSAGSALDKGMFRAVLQMDHFLVFPEAARIVEPAQGVVIESLADWENALQKTVLQAKEAGFVAIKSPIAYQRSLDFAEVSRADAEALFDRLKERKGKTGRPDWSQNKPLHDYMFGKIAENCARYDLPLQIHTGFFYDTGRNVTQANPSLLIPFIIRHKDTRFVLMHGGYPFGGELLAMAKNLPNVTLDMCWTYVISPAFAARFLNEAIETVPADKVLGFGGDYLVPEGAYAHAMLCREVVSKVLADKVQAGYFSEAEALNYARGLLHDNALRVFRLQR